MGFINSKTARLALSSAIVMALLLSLAISSLSTFSGKSLANVPDGNQVTLLNSSFESKDGNLVVDTAGNKDWVNAPDRREGSERASGQNDDSFGGGAKEDIPNPKVVSGSIPNNKSDLTRFYVANETVTTATGQVKSMLYLAWTRANTLGSANLDFEFNQSTSTGSNGVTPVRTAGDVLITYDFEQGGAAPVLGLLTWITDPKLASLCFSSSSVPCWGDAKNLSAAKFAEGEINRGSAADPFGNAPLPAMTFGEAAIDLSAAGLTSPDQCKHFGRAFVKSRSSTSFQAELKDFIRPIPVNINTCGSLTILKHDDLGQPLAGATFTITPNPSTGSGSLTVTDGGTGDADLQANGEVLIASVLVGQYSIIEVTPPPGWAASSQILTVTVGPSSAITVGPFVNAPLLKLLVQVVREDNGAVVDGVMLTLGGSATGLASTASGDCTFTGSATQMQTGDPSVKTGVWDNLHYSCMENGSGYQVTVNMPH